MTCFAAKQHKNEPHKNPKTLKPRSPIKERLIHVNHKKVKSHGGREQGGRYGERHFDQSHSPVHKEMHRIGAIRVVVVGVPPMGCMPLFKTLKDEKNCVETYNQAVSSLNSKIQSFQKIK